jgi:hypothetical protein
VVGSSFYSHRSFPEGTVGGVRYVVSGIFSHRKLLREERVESDTQWCPVPVQTTGETVAGVIPSFNTIHTAPTLHSSTLAAFLCKGFW